MTLTLSMPMDLSEPVQQPAQQPVFKSARAARRPHSSPIAPDTQRPAKVQPHLKDDATEQPDTQEYQQTPAATSAWYDEATWLEAATEYFWGRRTLLGDIRTRNRYRATLHWQALASLPLFPPIGFLVILANICFGLRPKVTRLGFFASIIMGLVVASTSWLADTPSLMAALR